MKRRKASFGVAVLCVLVLTALVATTAAAEQRAYTCTKSASTKEFSDAHCLSKTGAEFGHALVKEGEVTTIVATNGKTASNTTASSAWKLRGKLTLISTEVQCTGARFHGTLLNAAASVSGTGTIVATGCTVTEPAGKGCKVVGGKITTTELLVTTAGQAANKLKVSPAPGSPFFNLLIEGCKEEMPPALSYPVGGSFVANLSGATVNTTHAELTAQGTLGIVGFKAGIESSLTISMAEGATPAVTEGEAITFT